MLSKNALHLAGLVLKRFENEERWIWEMGFEKENQIRLGCCWKVVAAGESREAMDSPRRGVSWCRVLVFVFTRKRQQRLNFSHVFNPGFIH